MTSFKEAWRQLQNKEPEAQEPNGSDNGTYIQVKVDPSAPHLIIGIPEWVTPAMAQEWKDAGKDHPFFNNRNISKIVVQRYRQDMLEGLWMLTHQPVAIAPDGVALDGGHRIEALATLDGEIEGVWMSVARDVPYEIMPAIDDSFKRGFHHDLQIKGETYSTDKGAMVKLARIYERASKRGWKLSTMQAQTIPSKREAQQWEDLFRQSSDFDNAVAAAAKLYPPVLKSATGAFYLLLSLHVGEQEAQDFLDRLATGANLDAGDPRLVLKQSLIDQAMKSIPPSREFYLCLLIKGYNSYAKGETDRKEIVFRKSEVVPPIRGSKVISS